MTSLLKPRAGQNPADPGHDVDPIFQRFLAPGSDLSLSVHDAETVLAWLWDRLAETNLRLDGIDPARLDDEDRAEVERCKQVLGGFVLGILEMSDNLDESRPFTDDVRTVVEEFCQITYTAARYIMIPPPAVIRF